MNGMVKRTNIERFALVLLALSMMTLAIPSVSAVEGPPPPPGFMIWPTSATLNIGDSQTFTVTAIAQDQGGSTVPIPNFKINFTSSNTAVGTVTPSSAFTDTNGNATVTFNAVGAGSAYVMANNSTTGSNTSAAVTVNPQYYLTVNTNPAGITAISGSGWYNSGTSANTGTAPSTVTSGGTTYDFSTWQVDGSPVGGNPISVLMNAPHTATAVYQVQAPTTYDVTVTTSGLPASVSTNVYADGSNQGSIPGGGTMTLTFNVGTTHQISVDSPISGIGVQYVETNSPQSVSGAAALTFNYNTQYYLTVNTNPAGITTISGSGWYDSGATANTGTAPSTVTSGGTTYNFSTWQVDGSDAAGNPISVLMSAPHTATAVYEIPTPPPPPQLMILPNSTTLNVGESQTFIVSAVAQDQNGAQVPIPDFKIDFTSSDPAVGTVNPTSALTDANGNATVTFNAIGAGSAFVNATNSTTGSNTSATVTVTGPQQGPPPPQLMILPNSTTLIAGDSKTFIVSAFGQDELGNQVPVSGFEIDFSSSNTAIGTVTPTSAITDLNGNATVTFNAIAAGSAFVLANNTTVGSNTSAIVIVTESQQGPPPPKLMILPDSTTLNVGESQTFIVSAVGQNQNGDQVPVPGFAIDFSSSNTAIGTVTPTSAVTDANGNATVTFNAIGAGSAFVLANNTTTGANTSAIVTVNAPPSQFSVTKDFRFTNVDFVPIDDSGVQQPAILGGLLPDADGNGKYDVSYVLKKNGKVASTNPGQVYGVITITGAGVDAVNLADTFGTQFDVNPAKLGGGIEVITVDAAGLATVITDTAQVTSATVDNAGTVNVGIDLDTPLGAGESLMIYIKYQTALKGSLPDNSDFINSAGVAINSGTSVTASATIEFV